MKKNKEVVIPVVPEKKEMSKGLLVGLSVAAVIVVTIWILISWAIGTYNTFVIAKTDVATQWSNVKTEYQRRADLVVNMAEVAKGYANFEQDTMVEVIKARGGNLQGSNKIDDMKELQGMDSAISRLLVVFEQYPNLKTVDQYNKLTEELQRTENRVNIARTDYNSVVRSYNVLIKKFPANVLASWYGFSQEEFFEAQLGSENAPKLNMTR